MAHYGGAASAYSLARGTRLSSLHRALAAQWRGGVVPSLLSPKGSSLRRLFGTAGLSGPDLRGCLHAAWLLVAVLEVALVDHASAQARQHVLGFPIYHRKRVVFDHRITDDHIQVRFQS